MPVVEPPASGHPAPENASGNVVLPVVAALPAPVCDACEKKCKKKWSWFVGGLMRATNDD